MNRFDLSLNLDTFPLYPSAVTAKQIAFILRNVANELEQAGLENRLVRFWPEDSNSICGSYGIEK